jgi:hypothetical protein
MTLSLAGILSLAGEFWERTSKADVRGSRLADAHYSRQSRGARLYMPPGNTITLVLPDGSAVFGWHRPDPSSGVKRMDGFDGWCCSIFRNESIVLSSSLILDAERILVRALVTCGPTGLFTYVEPGRVRSRNPGYCFQKAGWAKTGHWSSDGKKRLYIKPWFALVLFRSASGRRVCLTFHLCTMQRVCQAMAKKSQLTRTTRRGCDGS